MPSANEKGVMLRSALSISAGLAVISVALATLWVSHGPRPQVTQGKQASAVVPISQQPQRLDAKGQVIRTIATGSSSGSAVGDTRPAQNGMVVDSTPSASIPPAGSPSSVPADPSTDTRPPTKLADVAPVSGLRSDTTGNSASEPSATNGTVDLNSASVDQLNALGAGMIGKRIVEFRPYATPEDLVTRRVLKKSDYETIRSAITVR
jgi:DNA uptake protein ComE-like DNA-binding protein